MPYSLSGHFVFLIQLVQPLQRFRNIAVGVGKQLHKHIQQLLEFGFALLVWVEVGKMESYHKKGCSAIYTKSTPGCAIKFVKQQTLRCRRVCCMVF
jgi:hypothetical protein